MLRKTVIAFCVALFAFGIGSYFGYNYDWTYFLEKTFYPGLLPERMVEDLSLIHIYLPCTQGVRGSIPLISTICS